MTLAGLRPGEKLFEEKLMAEEGLKKTKNKLIHIGCPIPFNTEQFLHQLTVLMKAAYDNDQNIREMVELIVPTWGMDPAALEKAFEMYPEVKLVVYAELYGFPGNIKQIKEICEKHGALLVEDAAEAMGAT